MNFEQHKNRVPTRLIFTFDKVFETEREARNVKGLFASFIKEYKLGGRSSYKYDLTGGKK